MSNSGAFDSDTDSGSPASQLLPPLSLGRPAGAGEGQKSSPEDQEV